MNGLIQGVLNEERMCIGEDLNGHVEKANGGYKIEERNEEGNAILGLQQHMILR